ncbi:hypothetical protein AVEN_133769-1 [Araneus ventricosus]|uniref:Uncharacterized protein n=1 Tax=Araneus ventricosus TaxID=182803 RepID=A0A4Y2W5Y0_ARAVE|nr:hypothetical protein AVEN_133769-1 [Araneus ventricosus]
MSRACLISGFVEVFSTTHYSPLESSTFIAGLAHKQLGKFPSLLVRQLLECPRHWNSFFILFILHTFRRFNDNFRRSRPCPLNGRPSKRGYEKNPLNYWDVWGKVAPDVSLQVDREILRTSIANAAGK